MFFIVIIYRRRCFRYFIFVTKTNANNLHEYLFMLTYRLERLRVWSWAWYTVRSAPRWSLGGERWRFICNGSVYLKVQMRSGKDDRRRLRKFSFWWVRESTIDETSIERWASVFRSSSGRCLGVVDDRLKETTRPPDPTGRLGKSFITRAIHSRNYGSRQTRSDGFVFR